jgi:DNA-directed RNA polymerase specialized sigma subunit
MERSEVKQVRDEWAQMLLSWVEEDVEGHEDVAVVEAQVAVNCAELAEMLLSLGELLTKRRAMAIRSMDGAGMSQEQIASAVGLSRQRVSQILNR